jgi:hypothetical protein
VKKEGDAIPQTMLPLIPAGSTPINAKVNVYCADKEWTYSIGVEPFAMHKANDSRTFYLTVAQLIAAGACRQSEIINAFGVSKSSVARAVRRLNDKGAEGFFGRRKGRRSGSVLTEEVLLEAQRMLDGGISRRAVAESLDVSGDTFRKALEDGRLVDRPVTVEMTDKSSRSVVAAKAAEGMGMSCTRLLERVTASIGLLPGGATTRFEPNRDVGYGGVLCALPALLANGLLSKAGELLGRVSGYYTMPHILILLASMALARIRTVEELGGKTPGELGLVIGLDRIPEVRCLRKKMDQLSAGDSAEKWAAHLSGEWMKADVGSVGTLYVDGHVRVYHGSAAKLPRHYVSRERLCLRGTSEYWVNDSKGRPFFVVERVVDSGLLEALRTDIVPRLLKEVPQQPTIEELTANPLMCRFTLVFDREGYSPEFFKEMWERHRIACVSYHKHPGPDWPKEWFSSQTATLSNGETVSMQLAERGSLIGLGKSAVWMREVRKLTGKGHQTSIIATEFEAKHDRLAVSLFSRWCQENFFKYMMEHFAIDLIAEYGATALPDTTRVVNPAWRQLENRKRSIQSKLTHRRAVFAALTMQPEDEHDQRPYNKWLEKKALLLQEIQALEQTLDEVTASRKTTPHHMKLGELPEADKFSRLLPNRKRLLDTIRMIAYRAETAMIPLLTGSTVDSSEARALLQNLFKSEADIIPQPDDNRLLIRLHHASTPATDAHLAKLFTALNASETIYPATNLQMIFQLVTDAPKKSEMVSPLIP